VVTRHVSCDNGLEQDLTLLAGATGDTTAVIDDLPAGTVCAVTETADGSSSTVSAIATFLGSPATIPAGGETTVQVIDPTTRSPGR
jgi:Domain of unknown function (DUF5979)